MHLFTQESLQQLEEASFQYLRKLYCNWLHLCIMKTNRNITGDNWFSSVELVDKLKEHGLTYVGTMRKN